MRPPREARRTGLEPVRPARRHGAPTRAIADISMRGWVRNLVGFYGAGEFVQYGCRKAVPDWLQRGLARPAVARGLEIRSDPDGRLGKSIQRVGPPGPPHLTGRTDGMDATTLRGLQAPIKDKYRQDTDAALVTLRARGSIDDAAIACKVETGRALAVAGLHPATGGSGAELCSGDMLLEALVACAGVTLKAVATALEIELRGATVSAEGDLDFRGTLGVDKSAPVGFREIRLAFEVDSPAPREQLDQLLKLTERYCVVFQTINTKPRLDVRLDRTGEGKGAA